MAEDVVESKFEIDVSDYIQGIDKVIDKLEELDKKRKGETEETKKSWQVMSIALNSYIELVQKGVEAVKKVINVAIQLRDAADDQGDSIDALNLQLKNMNQYTEQVSENLQKHAKALEQTTNFTDNQIMEAQKLLLTFSNIGTDVIPNATEKLLDMAEVMGMDAKSAAMQLGKALNDPIQGVSALRRVGVVLSEQQEYQIQKFMEMNDIASAQGVILAELNKEFGGHAKLMKDELKTLSTSWQNFKEILGTAVKPAVDSISLGLATLLNNLTLIGEQAKIDNALKTGDYSKLDTNTIRGQIIQLQASYKSEKDQTKAWAIEDVLTRLKTELKTREELIKKQEEENRLAQEKLDKENAIIKAKKEQDELEKKQLEDANKAIDEGERRRKQALEKRRKEVTAEQDKINAGKERRKQIIGSGQYIDYGAAMYSGTDTGTSSEKPVTEYERDVLNKQLDENKKFSDKLKKQKEEDYDYALRLNEDIQKRTEEQLEAEKKANKEREKELEKRNEKVKELNEEMGKSYTDFSDVAGKAISDLLLGEQKSIAEYGKILSDKLAMRMASVAGEAGVLALWETAQGLAMSARAAGGDTSAAAQAAGHFASAATYGQTAAAAGLGALAASAASRGFAANGGNGVGNTETNNTETRSIVETQRQELNSTSTIYISENDYRKHVRDTMLPAIQKEMDSGKPLRVVKR